MAPEALEYAEAHVRAAMARLLAMLAGGEEHAEAARAFAEHLSAAASALDGPVWVDLEPDAARLAGVVVAGGDPVSDAALRALHDAGWVGFCALPGASEEELVALADRLAGAAEAPPEGAARAWAEGRDGALEFAEDDDGLAGELSQALSAGLFGARANAEAVARWVAAVDAAQAAAGGGDAEPPVPRNIEVPPVAWRVAELAANPGDAAVAATVVRAAVERAGRLFSNGEPARAMEWVRPVALVASGRLAAPESVRRAVRAEVVRLLGPGGREAVLTGWRAAPRTAEWRGPLFSLAQLAGPAEVGAVLAFGAALPVPELRRAVADGLYLAARREGVDLVQRLTLDEEGRPGTAILIMALAHVDDPMLVEVLLARASSPDPLVREAALVALRGRRTRRVAEFVRAALGDPESAVRIEAMRYVAFWRDEEAVPALLERLDRGTTGEEARALARALLLIAGDEGAADLGRRIAGGWNPPPEVVEALAAAGEAGRAALSAAARHRPDLRDRVRAALASAGRSA